MLKEYRDKLEDYIKNNDNIELRETIVYYIGFIEGLISVDCEPDKGFINMIERILNEQK